MKKIKLYLLSFLTLLIVFASSCGVTKTKVINKKGLYLDSIITDTINLTTQNGCHVFTTGESNYRPGSAFDSTLYYIIEAGIRESLGNNILEWKTVNVTFSEELASIANVSHSGLNSKKWILCAISDNLFYKDAETMIGEFSSYFFEYYGDSQAPDISGTNNFVVNVNNMLTKENILSHIIAYDETDGIITPVIVSSTYDPKNKTIGKYNMVIKATDAAGNSSEMTVTIHVVDVDVPVISANELYRYSYTQIPTLDEVLNNIVVTDNYDSNIRPTVVTETFSTNGGKIGTYDITVSAADSSGNTAVNKNVKVEIYDEIVPEIVIAGLGINKELYVGNDKKLTLEELKAKITVTDDYKHLPTRFDVVGYENYEAQYNKSNLKHQITINAYDGSNNANQLVFNIVVKDKIKPTFTLDNFFVVLGPNVELTPEQIKKLAARVADIHKDQISTVEIINTSDTNIKKARITLKDNTQFEINIETGVKIDTIVMSWYHYLYKWFTVLFNFDKFYKTGSFFDFKPRCKAIAEIYSKGIFYNR